MDPLELDSQNEIFNCSYDITDEGSIEDIYIMMREEDAPDIYFLTAVLSLLFLVGTLGNIIVICVFSRSFIKHTSTYFILTLAIVDLVICTVVLPGVVIKNWSYPFKADALCKTWEFIRMSTIPISALTLLAIGFDRFYLICMASGGPLSTSLAKLTISTIIMIGLSLGLPPCLGVGVYQAGEMPGEIDYLGLCMPNTLLISQLSLEEYWKVVVSLMCVIFLVLAIIYSLIFIKVYKQNKKWNSMKKNKVCPILDDCKLVEKELFQKDNGWDKLRRFARIIPTRKENGKIFFVHVQSMKAAAQRHPSLTTTTKGEKGDSGLGSTQSSRVSHSTSLNNSNKLTESTENMADRQEYSYGRQRRAHIKTAKVLCLVTGIYFMAYSPPLLISAGLIPDNMFLFYTYFIHSAANPIVYSFMNKKFRLEAKKLMRCQSRHR